MEMALSDFYPDEFETIVNDLLRRNPGMTLAEADELAELELRRLFSVRSPN